MRMTLQDYIDKYGEESGTKRFNGVIKLLASRKKTYESQPYARFTKDWFLWKYPEDGLSRFNDHVNKSRQSEENMIQRWGEELGKQKWQETVRKKNTLETVRAQKGEEAVAKMIIKRKEGIKKHWEQFTEDEKKEKIKASTEKSLKTKKQKYGNKTKLDIYLEKYGENGHVMYAEYLQKAFKSIGQSQEATNIILDLIDKNKWLLDFTLYYRDPKNLSKTEWFLSNKTGVWFYDFCIKEAKAILEYDGSRWHPTIDQVKDYGDILMDIIGISYAEKYQKDQKKLQIARDYGFEIFLVRSDFTADQKNAIINNFLNYVKGKLNV